MRSFLILLCIGLILAGCVSKKTYQSSLDRTDRIQDSLSAIISSRDIRIDTLELALAHARGGNEALLITQDRLQDRLDVLQLEIDRLNQDASSTQADLGTRIQSLQAEIDRRQTQLDGIKALLQRRNNRLSAIEDSLRNRLGAKDLAADRYAIRTRNGQLTLSLNEEILFRSGSTSRMLDEGESALTDLVAILRAYPEMFVEVIGHTDNQPVRRESLDNWQYSALRAVSVTKFLTEESGLGPNRAKAASRSGFAPRQSNETPEGQLQNRRVDLLIYPTDSDLERDILRIMD